MTKNLLTVLVAALAVDVVRAGGTQYMSVEPFLGEWCAAQFPDQLSSYNGYSM